MRPQRVRRVSTVAQIRQTRPRLQMGQFGLVAICDLTTGWCQIRHAVPLKQNTDVRGKRKLRRTKENESFDHFAV